MDLTKAKFWFVTLSCIALILFVISTLREEDREWKKYQKAFYAMEQERGIDRDYTLRVKQIWNEKAERTDRCITCHVAMEDPDVQVPYTQNPFKSHPNVEMMKNHSISKMGCTVCHDGQGQATGVETGHGLVHHWDYPMLIKRGGVDFVQASCTRCHDASALPQGTEIIVAGKALFDKYGCIGCHIIQRIAPDGGVQGPELTGLGSKSESLLSKTHSYQHIEKISHYEYTTKYQWLYQHFIDPAKVTPGNPHTKEAPTLMPNFQMTPTEAKVLTAFIMALRDPAAENLPAVWMAKSQGRYSVVKLAASKNN